MRSFTTFDLQYAHRFYGFKGEAQYLHGHTVSAFVEEMERRRIIGKRVWYDTDENTVFIEKTYACDSGGGCPKNKTPIGERCHCDHYNHSMGRYPKYYCKCGAEFYRPMFAPLFGQSVLIEPYKTVLSGDPTHNNQIMRWNRLVARRNSAQAEDFRK